MFIWIAPVWALGVTPTQIVFDSATDTFQEIRIMGDSSSPLAIEMSIRQRRPDTEEDALLKNECITLSLPQAYIVPRTSVTVIIKHKGSDSDCQTGSFYLVVESLNITGRSQSSNHQVAFSFRLLVPVHINPGTYKNIKADLYSRKHIVIANVDTGAVLYSTFDLQLRTRHGWRHVKGETLAKRLKSDALLPGESLIFDPSAALGPDTEYQGVRVRARSIPSNVEE
ncbi:hypothetical protein [Marinobacter sp. X15-166B]|uniref:hypothetical protein n=1 Tax=Marinobacter sp. X15-166B TaxID=1897620 RepID=UPI00114C9585|nr:hypothetical protein [Marinobacter sp. X15-166B]